MQSAIYMGDNVVRVGRLGHLSLDYLYYYRMRVDVSITST